MSNFCHGLRGLLAAFALCAPAVASANTGTIQDVKHVVILMQENRSFDHYYGSMRGVRGFNDPNILRFQNGSSDLFQSYNNTNFVLPFAITNTCITDVAHDEDSGLVSWNYGFWNQWYPGKGPECMTYFTRSTLHYYYALADACTICDANFASFPGPTFPNRIYLFTGMVDPNGTGGGPILNNTIPTNGLSWTTYPERLQNAGVSWKVYRPVGDWFGDALQWFSQYKSATPGNPLYDRGMAETSDLVGSFLADITNNTLPQVSWVVPTDLNVSEHPPASINKGVFFVSQILSALKANTNVLDSTVFILTYDENGGYFDHVPSPVAPPGTAGEYAGGGPVGLGVRVPMLIVSPWSRGGKVCSQVFDHTSIIRFIETWTGVQEPNISAWRRQVCGDLTSAFDFAHPDYSPLVLPSVVPDDCPIAVVYPQATQTYPVQESGVRPACPLPYQPDAAGSTDSGANRFNITLTNAGTTSVHFALYANAYRFDVPRQYDAPPGGVVKDSFVQPSTANGGYDFTCYGPNGFQRRFAGNILRDSNQIEISSSIDSVGGAISLTLQNFGTNTVNYTVADNLNSAAATVYNLPPVSSTNCMFWPVANNNGWYDLTVTADADTNFLRHLAGHVENGSVSTTEIPVIVGDTPVVSTNSTGGGTGTGIGGNGPTNAPISSIYDVVNQLIAQNSLAMAGTNYLTLNIGAFATNCALIYPGWASNFVVESSASMSPPSWSPAAGTLTTISNCNVVILPSTNAGQFFRLRQ